MRFERVLADLAEPSWTSERVCVVAQMYSDVGNVIAERTRFFTEFQAGAAGAHLGVQLSYCQRRGQKLMP